MSRNSAFFFRLVTIKLADTAFLKVGPDGMTPTFIRGEELEKLASNLELHGLRGELPALTFVVLVPRTLETP
jgi:hypothetical protein